MALKATQALTAALEELLSQNQFLLVLRLTILLVLLHGASSWALDVPLRVLCGLMILSPPLLTSRSAWFLVSGCLVFVNAIDWFWIDNHKYLITYWCIACTVAVADEDGERLLSRNARLLIGLTFVFAVVWKMVGGQYVNGAFMHETLLTDGRLARVVSALGGLPLSTLAENRMTEMALSLFPQEGLELRLTTTERLKGGAKVLSYGTLAIEGLIGVAFLAGSRRLFERYRDVLLLAFIFSTYVILPVAGFAFVLTAMGVAQCPIERRSLRAAYIGAFVFVQLIGAPWDQLLVVTGGS